MEKNEKNERWLQHNIIKMVISLHDRDSRKNVNALKEIVVRQLWLALTKMVRELIMARQVLSGERLSWLKAKFIKTI